MNKRLKNVFRFTLVHRFTLERINDVFAFGETSVGATRHVRELFSPQLYDVEQIMAVQSSRIVVVGYFNMEDLL